MSSDDRLIQILYESRCLSPKQLLDLLAGRLYPEELRAVEMHLAACQLCSTALAGLSAEARPQQMIDQVTLPAMPAPLAAPPTPELPAERSRNPREREPKKQLAEPRKNSTAMAFGAVFLLIFAAGFVWWSYLREDYYTKEKAFPRKVIQRAAADDSQDDPAAAAAPSNESSQEPEPPPAIESAATGETETAPSSSPLPIEEPKPAAKAETPAVESPKTTARRSDSVAKPAATEEPSKPASRETVKETTNDIPAAESPRETKREESKDAAPGSDYEIGLSLFKKQQYASALIYLSSIEREKNHPHYWDALYYAAVSNKRLKNTSKAKKQFKQIIKAGVPQKEAAEEQLADM